MRKPRTPVASSSEIDNKLRELGLFSTDEEDRDASSESDEALAEESRALVPETDEEDADVEERSDEIVNPLEEEDDDDAPAVPIVPKRSGLRDALFAEEVKPPKISPPAITPIPEVVEPPFEPVYVLPQERVRKEKPVISPATRKLGAALAKKMPGAERLRISKRSATNGTVAMIAEYSAADLANSPDVESFIFKFLKPKWGAGTYVLTGLDPSGHMLHGGEIHMAEPEVPTAPGDATMDLLKTMLERQEREQKEREQQMATPVDPIAMLTGIHNLSKDMAPPAPKEDNTVMGMMAMMMQMQQQSAQQMTQMLVTAMQPKEDPTMKLLLAKLVEEKSSGGSMSLPPPPPPPPNPLEGIKELILALAPIVAPFLLAKRDDGLSDIKELMKATMQKASEQALSPRDVIALMTDVKQSSSTDGGFKQSVDQLGMLFNIVQSMKGQQEQQSSGGATFWDALAALASNRDLGSGIAQTLRMQNEAKQQQALLAQKSALLRQQRDAAIAIKAAPAGHPVASISQGGVTVPQQAPQQVAQVVQMRPQGVPNQPVVTTPPIVTPAPVSTQATTLSDVPPKPAPGLPELPAMTFEHLNGLVAAVDEPDLLGKTVTMLVYFSEFEDWKPLVDMLLTYTQQDKRQEAVALLHQLFTAFVNLQLLGADVAQRVVEGFAKNFDVVRNQVQGFPIVSPESNPIEDAIDGEEDDEEDEDDEEEHEDDEEEETDGRAATARA